MIWHVDGLIPAHGSINLLGGNTHSGKSTLLYDLVRSLRYSVPFFGRDTRAPKEIAVLLADRPAEDNPMWVRALNEGLIDNFLSAIEDRDYIETIEITSKTGKGMEGWEKFKKLVDKMECPEESVLIVDVFTSKFLGNLMSIVEVGENMDSINAYCHKRKITVIGTGYGVKPTQDKKQRYTRYIDRMIGASSLRGGASSVMYLATVEEAYGDGYNCQVLEAVPRNGPPVRIGLQLDSKQRTFIEVPLVKREDAPKVKEPAELRCYNILLEVPVIATSGKEIYAAYEAKVEKPVTFSRFRDYLSQLVKIGEIEIVERGVYRRVDPVRTN